jgi:hypothetical protein
MTYKDHLGYLKKTVGTKPVPEIARELGVPEKGLREFIHRTRIFKVETRSNVVYRLIREKFTYPEYFNPNENFYKATGIRQKRWFQLFRGERKATEREYLAICQHLKIDAKTSMDVRQLDIFETT